MTERWQEALLALGTVVGGELGERDLDRVLDVLLLSQSELDDDHRGRCAPCRSLLRQRLTR